MSCKKVFYKKWYFLCCKKDGAEFMLIETLKPDTFACYKVKTMKKLPRLRMKGWAAAALVELSFRSIK